MALSGVMQRIDDNSYLWYRRTFKVPEAWNGKRTLLHISWEPFAQTLRCRGYQARNCRNVPIFSPPLAPGVVRDPERGQRSTALRRKTPATRWNRQSLGRAISRRVPNSWKKN